MNIKEILEKKINEKQRQQKAKIVKKVAVGAIAGVAAGIVGGVLLAPKAGKEIRDDIAKTAKELGETAITKSIEMKEILDNKVVETKINATAAKEKIAKYLVDKKEERNKSKIEDEDEVAVENNIDKTEE